MLRSAIGIDLGIKKFATLSDGRVYAAKNSFKKRQDRLANLQQRLSKKEKGSSNFKKLKKRINKVHTKIANIRQDYLHQVSTDISKNHALVVLEDLKVANMSKSASGMLEEPGKMVAAIQALSHHAWVATSISWARHDDREDSLHRFCHRLSRLRLYN